MYPAGIPDLRNVIQRAKDTDSAFILHCGDVSNDYLGSPELIKELLENPYGIPVYGIYGNHELESKGNTMAFVTPLLTNRRDDVLWGTDDGTIKKR